MLWTTLSTLERCEAYDSGVKMLLLIHSTLAAQAGRVPWPVEVQSGSPERDKERTCQFLETAAWQIRVPLNHIYIDR